MSDRPTVSIYSNGKLIECFYMRNWPQESLLVECERLVSVIGNATERDKILSRLDEDHGNRCEEGEPLFREEWSEFPVVIDLTGRMVYLKDEYPDGHPEDAAHVIDSLEDYQQACDAYTVWPPERPLTFRALEQICAAMGPDVPDGALVAKSRDRLIESELPSMLSGILEGFGMRAIE